MADHFQHQLGQPRPHSHYHLFASGVHPIEVWLHHQRYHRGSGEVCHFDPTLDYQFPDINRTDPDYGRLIAIIVLMKMNTRIEFINTRTSLVCLCRESIRMLEHRQLQTSQGLTNLRRKMVNLCDSLDLAMTYLRRFIDHPWVNHAFLEVRAARPVWFDPNENIQSLIARTEQQVSRAEYLIEIFDELIQPHRQVEGLYLRIKALSLLHPHNYLGMMYQMLMKAGPMLFRIRWRTFARLCPPL